MKGSFTSLFLLVFSFGVCHAQAVKPAQKAADGKRLPITVKSSSEQNRTVLVEARYGSKSFELECQQERDDCKLLESGDYKMERLGVGSGIYMDCENADIYAKSAASKDDNKLGEYCLLQDPE